MSTTVTTHASYGKRLGDSLKGILFGLVVFIAGFPLLFWNEGRNVIRANALKEAEAAMVEAEYDNVDSSLEGKVVHVSGMATTDEILQDGLLPIAANAISLVREVQMYQWLEESKSETKKKVGGSTDTVTTYSYTKDWVSHPVDSSRFQEAGHQNPPEFPLQDETIYASLVSFGARRLSESQVAGIGGASALHASSSLSSSNAEAVVSALPGYRGHLIANGFYFTQANVTNLPSAPSVGDVRVTFEVVKPHVVSVVAKQSGDSFVPYVARNKGMVQLLSSGERSGEEMFASAKAANKMIAWILRLVGFLLMYGGLKTVLRPLSVAGDVLPFLGKIIGMGTSFIAFLVALPCALVTIAVAWVFYRPVLAIALLILAAAVVAFGIYRAKAKKAE